MRTRLRILSLLFLAPWIIVVVKLFSIQILKGQDFETRALRQRIAAKQLPAHRGEILSSDGFPLATSKEMYFLWADPTKVEDKHKTAKLLAENIHLEQDENLGETIQKIEDLLSKDVKWVLIRDRLSKEEKEKIEKLDLEGIGFDPFEARDYPEGSMAAHLLGFVGKDESGKAKGYFGLEGYYDLTLSGKPGSLEMEEDLKGRPILFGKSVEIPSSDGLTLGLNIDRSIQYIVESKLKEGLQKYGASAGSVLVMKPEGQILAMASEPSYDPSAYWKFDSKNYKNPAISDAFEPGSIFKVLVMSAALDAEVVQPETKCDTCGGPLHIDKYTINTWNNKYFPDSSMTDIIVHSDNVGMAFVGQKLGSTALWDYLNKFGIGRLTEIDLQGETNPGLRQKDEWSVVDLVTASFGQGVAVTSIQMLKAVGAIANNGVVPVPQVVGRIIGLDGEKEISVKSEGRVISEKAVSQIKDMMVAAVEQGESKWAAPKGFKIAGKTGTAQIPIAGHYDKDKTIASFIGFAPANNPQFVMLVTLREPTSSPWGSETAAPLWYNIAKDLFLFYGIHPDDK